MAGLPTLLCSLTILSVLVPFGGAARGKARASVHSKRFPGISDEYEYGDKESHESSADASDFSMHQFMVDDDARDGASVTGDDNGAMEMARAKALKAEDHFGSEDTPDTSDAFVQTARGKRARKQKQIPGSDDGYEYGDRESHESNADASDFSIHQFMVEDDARDGASVTGDDNGAMEMARAKALKSQDHFGSEDTPDTTDAFVQTGRGKRAHKLKQIPGSFDEYEYGDKESHESSADASDFSMHQFMVDDDARDGASVTGDDNGAMEMARAKALKAQDHFGSEDTPDRSDAFVQTGRGKRSNKLRQFPGGDEYEYGDKESHESSADASDFSMHQFMVDDDARDGASVTGDDNGAMEMARAKALKAADHFGSEDTPDRTDAFVQTARSKRARKAKQIPGSSEGYEYGDKESHESSADASDFSLHQFLVEDDARDGAGITGDDNGAMEMARAKAMKAQDHFGSEDTPDYTDVFVQTGHGKRASKLRQFPGSGEEYEYGDKESHESSADASDFSMHQFMVDDDARDGAATTGDDNGAMEMARAKALKAQDHFGSEDTPDTTDAFVQTGRKAKQPRAAGLAP